MQSSLTIKIRRPSTTFRNLSHYAHTGLEMFLLSSRGQNPFVNIEQMSQFHSVYNFLS